MVAQMPVGALGTRRRWPQPLPLGANRSIGLAFVGFHSWRIRVLPGDGRHRRQSPEQPDNKTINDDLRDHMHGIPPL